MTNYIPTVDDLEPDEIYDLALGGNGEPVAERLQVSVKKLQHLIKQDEEALDLIRATVAEFEEFARLRLLLLTPNALDTLEAILAGHGEPKKVMAQVKAAEACLDRGIFPKQVRQHRTTTVKQDQLGLPDLDELVSRAGSPQEAMQLVERHQNLLNEIEALRTGAREIINVRPEIQEESPSTGTD